MISFKEIKLSEEDSNLGLFLSQNIVINIIFFTHNAKNTKMTPQGHLFLKCYIIMYYTHGYFSHRCFITLTKFCLHKSSKL